MHHHIRFSPPDPAPDPAGALTALPRPLSWNAGFKGPTSKKREGKREEGREEEGRRKGKGSWMGREGKGEGCVMTVGDRRPCLYTVIPIVI